MSGLIDMTPGYVFDLTGKGEWLTLPKLNALGNPAARVGENQITARELSLDITQEIGDFRTELNTEIEERIFADQAFVTWRQTLEAAYGSNLSSIQTQLNANASSSGNNASAIVTLQSNYGDLADDVETRATVTQLSTV